MILAWKFLHVGSVYDIRIKDFPNSLIIFSDFSCLVRKNRKINWKFRTQKPVFEINARAIFRHFTVSKLQMLT